MPAAAERYWTAEDVRALPDDGNRYECIDGELLVTPSPRYVHQFAIRELVRRLDAFTRTHALGDVVFSPADVELDKDNLVQPDFFIALARPGLRRVKDWRDIDGLRLAVEVLSPSTARYDRVVKRRYFQRAGVPEYWIVDTDARTFERWRPGDERPEILEEWLVWEPAPGARLDLDLRDFFAAFLDD